MNMVNSDALDLDDMVKLEPQSKGVSSSITDEDKRMINFMQQMQAEANSGVSKSKYGSVNNNPFINIKSDDGTNYYQIDMDRLPTGGLLYPTGCILEARPLKVLDVKKLSALNEGNADSIINDIFRRCVRGLDVDEIYLNDKIYILFWLRANSYRDNNYVVGFKCQSCEKDSTYHFEIDNVNVKPINVDMLNGISVTLESGDILEFSYLKIKDESVMGGFRAKYAQNMAEVGESIDDDILAYTFMLQTINGKPLEPLNKYNYLTNISPQDISTIETVLSKYDVGIHPYLTVKCDKCGGVSQTEITFRQDFFIPKNRSR